MAASDKAPSVLGYFLRNPDAGKVVLVAGLVVVCWNVTSSLVVVNLQNQVWGEHMAEYMANVNSAMYVVAIIFNGPMGRFGDRFGQRAAVACVVVLATLPTYLLLIAGANSVGLWLWCAARVLAGVVGMTSSGCASFYALVHEVADKKDAAMLMGMVYAGASLLWITGQFVGAAVMKLSPGSSRGVLLYIAGLSVLPLLLLASMRGRQSKEEGPKLETLRSSRSKMESPKSARPSEDETRESPSAMAESPTPRSLPVSDEEAAWEEVEGSELALPAPATEHAEPVWRAEDQEQAPARREPTGHEEEQAAGCFLIAPLRFAIGHPILSMLCGIMALVCVAETVLFDVLNQFALSNLGLLNSNGGGDAEEASISRRVAMVALALTTAIQISLLFGSLAVGLVSKYVEPHKLILSLVPLVALFQCVPMIVRVLPSLFTVIVASAMTGLAVVVMPPLQAAVARAAPEGHVGEAMGAVNSCKCLAGLAGNILLSLLVPVLQRSGLERPLWILFPICAAVTFFAWPLAIRHARLVAAQAAPASELEAAEP